MTSDRPTVTHPEVPSDGLRWRCRPEWVRDGTPDDATVAEIIGQERAVNAILMGCELQGPGYNVFVCGPSGTGKTSTIRSVLAKIQDSGPFEPKDRVYVNRFRDRDRPRLLVLPPGEGVRLRKAMDDFVRHLCREIPRALDGESFQQRRDRAVSRFEKEERRLIRRFEEKARRQGFVLSQIQSASFSRPDLLLVVGKNRHIEMDELSSAIASGEVKGVEVQEVERKYQQLRAELDSLLRTVRRKGRDLMEEVARLEREAGRAVVGGYLDDLREAFPFPGVADYLEEVEAYILDHLDLFVEPEDDDQENGAASRSAPRGPAHQPAKPGSEADPFRDFRVNVILDNSGAVHRPVVVETNPTYANLFGTVERDSEEGSGAPHFMRLKGGSLLQADQGFLVFHAPDAFGEPGVWKTLKRTLKHGLLEIQPPEGQGSPMSLKPEPIAINVKVIVTGDSELYYDLFLHDEEFRRIFKVKADFEEYFDRTPDIIHRYGLFVRRFCREEGLRPVTDEAVAAVVEAAAREADRAGKLSARLSVLADLLREANFFAAKAGAERLDAVHVEEARRARRARHDLPERRYREETEEGLLRIETRGAIVGQVNGLTVFDFGDHRFGRPCLITATVGAGKDGILSIEREAELSGPIHSKGVLVIAGFLRGRFGGVEPLALSSSICFEQSYDEVEGDSASLSELCAILSALSGVPLRQGVAVTGSLNQAGLVQAVGGVNEKIEGFFDLCMARGLDGSQGVIIPRANVGGLMLDSRVVEAAERGEFHIWPVGCIEEALEILTDVPAGEADAEGNYPDGTVFRKVQERLRAFAMVARERATASRPHAGHRPNHATARRRQAGR